ncbi:hypothetical protein CKQ90_35515, partial [Klebsiella pneumoniae]
VTACWMLMARLDIPRMKKIMAAAGPLAVTFHRARDLGFPGLVTACWMLMARLDIPRMKKIMAAAGPLAVTFHRA